MCYVVAVLEKKNRDWLFYFLNRKQMGLQLSILWAPPLPLCPQWGFVLHFLWLAVFSIFSYACESSSCLFWKNASWVSCLFFNQVFVCLFVIRLYELLLYFEYYSILWMEISFGNAFPFQYVVFSFLWWSYFLFKTFSV